MSNKAKSIFDKRVFWDADFDKRNCDQTANWAKLLVLERGDVPVTSCCKPYFGTKKTSKVVKTYNPKQIPIN